MDDVQKKKRKRPSEPKNVPKQVLMFRACLGRYPNKEMWATIVEMLGDNPDQTLLHEILVNWYGNKSNFIAMLQVYKRKLAYKRSKTRAQRVEEARNEFDVQKFCSRCRSGYGEYVTDYPGRPSVAVKCNCMGAIEYRLLPERID